MQMRTNGKVALQTGALRIIYNVRLINTNKTKKYASDVHPLFSIIYLCTHIYK